MRTLFSFWRKEGLRSLTYQWGVVAALVCGLIWVYDTATTNMARLGLKTGFDFLNDEAVINSCCAENNSGE